MKRTKIEGFKFIFAIAIAFAPVAINASPAINGVSGQCTEGSSLTLLGSDFGSGGAPLLADTVENQASYSSASDGDEVPWGVWEDHPYNYDDMFLETSDGALTGAMHYKSGAGTGFLSWPSALDNTPQRSLYVAWMYKPSVGPNSNGGSNKHIRIWDLASGTGTRISWTSMHMTYGPNGSLKTSWGSFSGIPNQWNMMEIWADAASGRLITSINGSVTHDLADFVAYNTSEGLKVKLLGFDSSISSLYPSMITELDNIYIASTRARVELSDSAVWDPSSMREILAVERWSQSQVNVEIRQGRIASLNNAYLYVINANNEPSAAYKLSCDVASTPSPPKAPPALTATEVVPD